MRFYLLLTFFLFTHHTQANELTLSSIFIQSTEYGFDAVVNASMDFALNEHWQIGGGGKKSLLGKTSIYEIYLGPTYNFQEKKERSWFVSFGLGYSNHYSDWPTLDPDTYPSSSFWYAKFGKRFSLSKSNKVTYKPNLEIKTGIDESKTYFKASPISFSFFF